MNPSIPARSARPVRSVQSTGYLVLAAVVTVPLAGLFLIGYLASVVFSLLGLSISDVLWYADWI